MKKILITIICVSMLATVLVACSQKDKPSDTTTESTAKVTVKYTTDDAVIAENDAILLVKSYSPKELSLTKDEYNECSFLVAGSGELIEDKYYIQVVAAVKTAHENDGETTYTFDNKGEYYISYDGKTMLKKNMKSEKDEYTEMKVKEVPTTTEPAPIIIDGGTEKTQESESKK